MSQSIQIPVTQVGLEQSIVAAMKRIGSSSQINLGTSSKQINALSQPLGRITGQADEFTKSMAAANARVLAFGASAGIIAGVSSAMSGLLASTIKVEKSLVEINSVLNETSAGLDKFGQDIFNVAKNTGKSFDEVAKGALELARQGLNAEDTLARLNDALILSRLSGLDAAQSVEGLTAAFNSFKKSGITTAEILNKVVAVSQEYAVSERDIIEGLKRSASVADLAGVSFEELAAVITAVQEKTARGGAVIGNAFKTIFSRIQDKAVLSDLDEMGVAVTGLQGEVLPALKILEGLAKKMEGISQIEQADISKKLGGVYQLDKLLAALSDLSDEASVTTGALKVMGEAGDSAYKKNAILNQTLESLLNKVAVSAEQLGAKLGEIGVTDSLKNVLGFFNNLLEGIQKILGEESGLGDLVRGLVKGLGSFLAGPGLALFGGIILKLSKDLVQFGFASLKAFFGIGKAAKEVQNVEGAISQILSKNVNLQQQLFALEGNRAAQLRLITGALVEQEALLRKSANISSGLAAPLYNVGGRAKDSGLRIGNSAGGYMPAVAKESEAIKQKVGGARSGDKPIIMPNFNFGGGKKGSIVAHTGEYIVPNFGGGSGSAIFNRDMVQKMGLPSGARKINAAGGFIPNFAEKYKKGGERTLEDSRAYFKKQKKETAIAAFENPNTSENDLIGASEALAKGKSLTYDFDASKFQFGNGMGIGLVALQDSGIGGVGMGRLTSDSPDIQEKLNAIGVPNLSKVLESKFRERNIDPSRFQGVKADLLQAKPNIAFDNIKISSVNALKGQFSSDTFKDFQQTVNRLFARPISDLGNELFGSALGSVQSGDVGDKYIFGKDVLGSIFESATQFYIKGANGLQSFQEGEATRNQRFDFPMENAEEAKRLNSLLFKNGGVGIAEAKLTANSSTLNSVVSKGLNNEQVVSQMKRQIAGGSKVSMANGFIPNFANPLKEAVGREIAAGASASQIYIDKSPSLKNAANPMGLMVANRRDEPAGGFQGINRARREGANPMMYGAAGGFVPNYAAPIPQIAGQVASSLGSGVKFGSDVEDAINEFGKKAIKAGSNMDKLSQQLEAALTALGNSTADSKKVAEEAKKQAKIVQEARAITAKENKAKIEAKAIQILSNEANKKLAKQLDKIYLEYNKSQKTVQDLKNAQAKSAEILNKNSNISLAGKKAIISNTESLAASRPNAQARADGNRDMLGAIFAVQGAMSALTGATDGASNSVAKFSNIVTEGVGSFATAAFAIQGIGQMGGAIGGIASKLGPYGLAIAGAYAGISAAGKMYNEFTNINQRAADSMARVAEAAQKAAVKLEDLSPTAQATIKQSAKGLLAGATTMLPTGEAGRVVPNVNYEGFDYFGGSELEKTLQASVDGALAAGASYDLMWNAIRKAAEEGGDLTTDEIDDLIVYFEKLQTSAESVKKVFSNLNLNTESGTGKDLIKMDRKTVENYAKRSGDSQYLKKVREKMAPVTELKEALRKANPDMDVNSPAASKLILDQYDMLVQKANEKTDAEKEAIEQTQTSIVQDKLKNAIALSIAKARSFENDILGQQLLKGQELGNLSETTLRNIQDQIALRDIDRELQDGTSNLIQEQISQAKKITAESEVALQLEQKFQNLTEKDLQDRDKVNSFLQETSQLLEQNEGLTQKQKNALQITLDKLFDENGIKKQNLKLTQDQTAQYKEQARQLDLISQASKIALQNQSTKNDIATNELVNADERKVRGLESSKLGKSDLQVRQIDQQIAAIKANTIKLEQSNTRQQIFENFKKELSENNKITDEEIKASIENEIALSKTQEALQELSLKIFLARTDLNTNQKTTSVIDFAERMASELAKQDEASKQANALAQADIDDAGRISPVIDALEMFRRSLLDSSQIIDQKIEDIKLQQLTSISGKELLQGNYDIETLRRQQNQTPEEAARIARQRQNKGLGQLFAEEYTKTDEERALNINQAIVDGSVQFKNNMIEGIMGAVEGTSSLKDGLRSAAYEFVKMINQKMMSNLVDKVVGGNVESGTGQTSGGLAGFFSNMFASGGKVTGGSGSKDDVPAMLMGGEYVVNKKAVSKYGPKFLEAINNGTLNGYAKGGKVQKGPQGNFYTPGTFGQGAIEGKMNLLDFATQTGTSGKFDQMINESGYQSISLEPESSRLSVSGMRNSPMFDATQSAKGQAFDLYLQQYNAEIEAKKQAKEKKKALRNQIIMMAASAALGPVVGAAGAGFKAAFGAAKAGGATGFQSFLAGTKGVFTGGQVLGQQVGGLNNLFSGVGKGLTGNFTGAANQFKLSQISNDKQLIDLIQSDTKFAGYIGGMDALDFSGVKRATIVPEPGRFSATGPNASISTGAARSPYGVVQNGNVNNVSNDSNLGPPPADEFNLPRRMLQNKHQGGWTTRLSDYQNQPSLLPNKAIGGMIPSRSGIDTVPAMLSGGEFVMNRSAVQSIGAPNLQSMNSGGTSITSEETSKELNEKLLAKLDELIGASGSTGNITINVAPSGQTSQETSQDPSASRQQLARQIKDAVLQIINDEKRIGGSLRR